GTGDFLKPLRKAVGQGLIVGLDFCLPMLAKAKDKSDASLGLADACRLPVQGGRFEAVTVGWGIRNVPDIDQAHREIARVLKPGGRFASLDMAQPRNAVMRRFSSLIFNTMVPRLGSLFGSKNAYTYLPKSTERFWSREELAESMRRAGFIDVRHKDLFFGNICAHFGRKP
ncbi:MAG TPA: class I SAM-dependent methyltransferase, partial [Fimbriimonas sp.]|nr:class I SAM-dependent methyltransferase [Fimbriimonas sp.]